MLKMFPAEVPASSVEVWEQTWMDGNFAESARCCDVDPLEPLFDRNVPPGSVLLEGGCGGGQYVVHLTARGLRAVGQQGLAAGPAVRLAGWFASNMTYECVADDPARS